MGFCPDSMKNPGVGGDYSTRWCVCILLLCCLNLITSMAQDKASHCGGAFSTEVIMLDQCSPEKMTGANNTQTWRIASKFRRARSFFLMVQQSKIRTAYLQLSGCFYSP